MDVTEHVAFLRGDGELLATAAEAAGADAEVVTCPGWQIRDLVRHVGGIHRWATGYVGERRAEVVDVTLADVVGAWPDDRDLVEWFREGHAALVQTLETSDAALQCWTFLPAPSPLAFWARRQAHETAMHRVDAESAVGRTTPCDPSFAADGIDELLFGFAARPRHDPPANSPRTIALHPADAGRAWLVRIGPEGIVPSNTVTDADCEVRASASDLYMLLWNRRSADGLRLTGDPGVLALWQDTVRIRWVE